MMRAVIIKAWPLFRRLLFLLFISTHHSQLQLNKVDGEVWALTDTNVVQRGDFFIDKATAAYGNAVQNRVVFVENCKVEPDGWRKG
jgi:hypothetical protein